METLRPGSEAELAETLAEASAAGRPLELVGLGSKRGYGRPLQVEATLDLAAFAGIRSYEPEELVLTAGPATPLAEIEAALAERGQALAFEPMDLGPVLGQPAGAGSLGGAIACNLSGPRRFKAGAARDHILGVAAVTGEGAVFKSGGRVVKNVTGYDLSKLIAGSQGTLAAMTELTLKVLPAPQKTRTLLVFGQDPAAAGQAMTQALCSAFEVSGAAWLPAPLAARLGIDLVAAPGRAVTALRLEGPAPSVAARQEGLSRLLGDGIVGEELHGRRSGRFWQAVRDAAPFAGDPRPLWRVSTAPTAGPALLAALRAGGEEAFLDWGGGLLWLLATDAAASAESLAQSLSRYGGHATLVRAPAASRAGLAQVAPQSEGLAALASRVKASFDPKGILNPGRLAAGL